MLIRKLKLYDLTDIGNVKTIELYQWINNIFNNVNIIVSDNGDVVYSLNNIKLFMQPKNYNHLVVEYDVFWEKFKTKFNLNTNDFLLIIDYITFKRYKIKYHMIFYSTDTITNFIFSEYNV